MLVRNPRPRSAFLCFLLFLGSSALWGQVPERQGSPLRPPRPGLVLVDDMWIPEEALHGDGVFVGTPWTNNTVRIGFTASVSSVRRSRMRRAWNEIEAVSGINFFEVNEGYSGDYILVMPNDPNYPNVSHSEVGMVGGEQELAVGANHWDPDDKYVLVHELMHALGYKHEQSRPDRNFFVTINYSAISQTGCNGSSCDGNFDIANGASTLGPYDFLSVMHYGQYTFSSCPPSSCASNPLATITCKPGFTQYQGRIGNRDFLSIGDANALQNVYGQPDRPVINTVTPNAHEATTASQLVITVTGVNYFEGSFTGEGVTGTVVRFAGTELVTTFSDENKVYATIPGNLMQVAGTYVVDVIQHSEAGGSSTTSVNFTVLPPPCLSLGDRVGQTVSGLDDANGDGVGDYVVGIPGRFGNAGEVRCYSGATAAILWQAFGGGGNNGFYGQALATLPDVNGDGVRDVLVGAPGWNGDRGRFDIRSGSNGTQLAVVLGTTPGDRLGSAVSGVGDIDGDGDQDFIVGAPGGANGVGRAEVWSVNGGLLRTHNGGSAGEHFGTSVTGGLDVTTDGVPDYAVGAPDRSTATASFVGRVTIISGASGSVTANRDGDGAYDRFGFSLAMVRDRAASLHGNIVVGAPETGNAFSGTSYGTGYVRVIGHAVIFPIGGSYATLATWTGSSVRDHYGWAVAPAGDVDDDGYEDVLIGIPQTSFLSAAIGPGAFEIRSSRTDQRLYRYTGQPNDEALGAAVANVGDVNQDARLDVLVGVPGSDVGCIDAGNFYLVYPPIAPEMFKVMITEVSTGTPDALELTNFDTSPVSLSNWTVQWKDGTTLTSAPLNITLAPGESCVVKEPGGTLPETPLATQVLSVLPNIGSTTGDVCIALLNARGLTVDEFRLESSTGIYSEGTLGGKFRGIVFHELTSAATVNAERIWGLDSNSGEDWTTGGPRNLGLESLSGGTRGYDPILKSRVVINEIDDNPDLVELHRPSSISSLLSPTPDLRGWSLLCSGSQGAQHVKISPFGGSLTLSAGQFVVLGESTTRPPETPANVPYFDVDGPFALGTGFPFTTEEYSCALYDSYGRLIDLVRTTGHDDSVVHNHPRAPAHWSDFMGAAGRGASGDAAVGRNTQGSDTNRGADFRALTVRTMGLPNTSTAPWTPAGAPELDVRLHDTALGGGILAIIHAGSEHAGQKWTVAFSTSHLQGTGAFIGLGPDAGNNWLITSVTLPFNGVLDSTGSARLDFPPNTLPAGVQTDDIFFLQINDGNQFSPATLYTKILEYDT